MISHEAEKSFRKGMDLLEAGRSREALVHLRTAITVEEQAHGECREARYLSYYGLCLCLSRTDLRGSLRLCRAAVKKDDMHPDLWWNAGKVAMMLGRRREAFRAWRRGLELEPDHAGILGDLNRLGVRRIPVFTFLSRQHPINVFLGRLRTSLTATGSSRGSNKRRHRSMRGAAPARARLSR